MYSKQHKRKALLTRISSILLSATIAFTSLPVTNVYATEKTNPKSKTEKDTVLGDRADNGGQGSSSTDKYIDADSNWEPVPGFDISHSGYRLFIIDEDLRRISPTYDFYFTEPTGVIDWYYDTRFDVGMSEEYKNRHIEENISVLKSWCTNDLTTKSWTDVPKPVIGNGGAEGHDSNGTTFKEWFLAGNPNLGTVTEKAYDTIINSSTGNGSTTTQETKKEPENKAVVPMTYLNIGTRIVNTDYSLSAGELNEHVLDKYYGQTLDKVYDGIMEEQSAPYKSTYIAKVKKYYKECPGSSLSDCCKAAVGDLSRYYKENILNYLYHNTVVDISGLREIEISYNSLDNLLQSNIPLAAQEDINGNFKNFGGLEDVIWTEDLANTPAYVLINSDATLQIPESYGAWPGQAIEEKNCALIVEPIFWIAIKTHESNDTEHTFNGKYYTKGYVYGTLWNLLNYPWKGGHGTYGELLSIVMCNSLANNKDYVVKSTGKTIKGVTPKQKYNPLSKAVDSMNDGYGLGLHVYDSEAFKKTTSSTSTYDENKITPAQSEDCSSKPEESSYKTLSKSVSIIKSYETVKSDGTVQNDGYFIRENCCHTIEIEDEDSINYKVVDWQSSSEQSLPYGLTEANSGNKNLTYEQLVQSSNKLQSGTSAGNTVVLTETEKILYVKLQKQETPPPSNTRLTGDYILNESELAKAFQITPISIEYTFPKISFTENKPCGNHHNCEDTDNDGDSDVHHYCGGASSSSGYISDSKATVTLKNEAESSYSNIIVQSDKAKFKSDMTVVELDRGTNADSFNTSANHKYTFNVYRYQQGEQNLTLCKYWQKQSSNKDVSVGTTQTIEAGNKDIAKTLGYSEANSKSTKSRADVDYIVNAVKFKFIFDTSSPDKSTSYYLHGDDCSCGDEHVGGYSRGKDIDTATTVESEADISVQVYSGTSNKQLHTKLWTETIGRNGEKYLPIRYSNANKTVGRQVQSTSTIKIQWFHVSMQLVVCFFYCHFWIGYFCKCTAKWDRKCGGVYMWKMVGFSEVMTL